MPLLPLKTLHCPLCEHALQREAGQWRCANNHSFDVARQGYVHLLPVQHKRSKDPGDSREMVAARRQFLDSQCYRPLAEALLQHGRPLLPEQGPLAILDAGCGDGYYLDFLCHALVDRQLTATGLDISKWAVRSCLTRNPGINGIVASNRKLPLPSDSQDLILCNFGFPVFDEFRRVLKPGGSLLLLDAGPDHLLELRQLLYAEVQRHPATAFSGLAASWQRLTETDLRYRSAVLNRQQLGWLLAMTPHFYRSSAEARQRLEQIAQLAVSIDVRLRILRHHVPAE